MTRRPSKGITKPSALPLMVSSALACIALLCAAGCVSPGESDAGPAVMLSYVGSSTIAHFMRDADAVYAAADFTLDTEPESVGGEQAILEGRADLAGVAGKPKPATLDAGIHATLIGLDAIAVVVHPDNPVKALSREQLAGIFTGRITDWSTVGGPALPIRPYIVGPESATRAVFRSAILGEADYASCEVVRPDSALPAAIAGEPGGIGQISFSFLPESKDVRAIAVEGEAPDVTNFRYPISRPLHLLWRDTDPAVQAFVSWALSTDGQRVVMNRFVGSRVVGSVEAPQAEAPRGSLIVYTETFPVYDGGIYYYPHRSYEILTRYGDLVRRVPNRRGDNDENPMRVHLPPDTYLIRPEVSRGQRPEFFVTVEAGKTTTVRVEELLREEGR